MTERLLYFSGNLDSVGEVHHGTAVMDFLEAERERGITIQSACVSFVHRELNVNLIDTPGHADFNMEVERSLRVLDGALVIVDSLKGVEAQTHTVVKQANKYNIPKVFVFNKMDQVGADFSFSIQAVEQKFKLKCLPLSVPVLIGEEFVGALDVVRQKVLFWRELSKEDHNLVGVPQTSVKHEPLTIDVDPLKFMVYSSVKVEDLMEESVILGYKFSKSEISELANEAMEEIVLALSEEEPKIFDDYLSGDMKKYKTTLPSKVARLIRKHPNQFSAGFPCSALKFRNIQQIMDAVIDYLPPPKPLSNDLESLYSDYLSRESSGQKLSKDKFEKQISDSNIFFIFKRQFQGELGHLAFGRMYSGSLKYGMILASVHGGFDVKVTNMNRIRANELTKIDKIHAGDIVCLNVPEKLRSGDYLVSKDGFKKWDQVLPQGYLKAAPGFSSSLDFETAADRQ